MKKNNWLWGTSFWVFLFLGSICHAEDEAIVLNVSGKAVHEGNKNEIAVADILSQGDKITLESDCILKINYFPTGVQEEIAGNGTITVGEKGSQKDKGSIRIKSQTVFFFEKKKSPIRKEDLQGMGVEVLRGDDDAAETGSEICMLRLAQTRSRNRIPELKWKKVTGAEKYRINISDDTDQVYPEIETELLNHKLEKITFMPGKRYDWNVKAVSGKQIISEAEGRFEILTEAEEQELAKREADVRKFCPGNDSPEQLISLAILYQQYKLWDDTAEKLLCLKKKYPDNDTFKKWLLMLPGYSSP